LVAADFHQRDVEVATAAKAAEVRLRHAVADEEQGERAVGLELHSSSILTRRGPQYWHPAGGGQISAVIAPGRIRTSHERLQARPHRVRRGPLWAGAHAPARRAPAARARAAGTRVREV